MHTLWSGDSDRSKCHQKPQFT